MPDKIPPSRQATTARAEKKRKSASDDAIADLQELVKVRLRSERSSGRRATVAKTSPANRAVFSNPDAARQAREAILGLDRGEEKDLPSDDSDDGPSPGALKDRFAAADRVYASVQSWVQVFLRVLACTLTVLAGCELAYAFDLMFFEEGRNGAILAVVLGCFAAARWITKD